MALTVGEPQLLSSYFNFSWIQLLKENSEQFASIILPLETQTGQCWQKKCFGHVSRVLRRVLPQVTFWWRGGRKVRSLKLFLVPLPRTGQDRGCFFSSNSTLVVVFVHSRPIDYIKRICVCTDRRVRLPAVWNRYSWNLFRSTRHRNNLVRCEPLLNSGWKIERGNIEM